MKITILLIIEAVAISFLLFSCGDSKTVEQKVAGSEAKTKLKNTKTQTVKTGDHTVSFESIQEWKIDERSSQIPPEEKAATIEQVGYGPIYSSKVSIANLIYKKGITPMNIDGAINGLIGAITKNPSLSVKDQKLEDVSDIYGFPAKMGSFRIVKEATNPHQYQYKMLVVTDKNELYMFLGMFEEIDGFDSKFFDDILKSVKINK